MGVLSFGSKSVPLGLELAGVVRRVGSNVRHVAIGDRVCAVAVEGCFTTNAILVAPLVHKIPDDLGFEEAATMPGCFTTAVQSLIDVGQLQKGQVSIHSYLRLSLFFFLLQNAMLKAATLCLLSPC